MPEQTIDFNIIRNALIDTGFSIITDTTTISNITNELNWINGVYQLDTTDLSIQNYYTDNIFVYIYDGNILTRTDAKFSLANQNEIIKTPTGFIDNTDKYNKNIIVTYDSTSRTVTLEGDFKAYYRGEEIAELTNGFISVAHDESIVNNRFLTYNGTDINQRSVFNISELLIAFVIADNNGVIQCNREVHGTEDYRSHTTAHNTIGTYRNSGGSLSNYTLNSTTATLRRPDIAPTVLVDEDLRSELGALLGTSDNYTIGYLTTSGLVNFDTEQEDFIKYNIANNRPYYNQYTGGVQQQGEVSNNQYMNYYLIAVPTSNDFFSKKYQYIFQQGQSAGTISTANSESSGNLNLGNLTSIAPEFVFISKITIRRLGDNWSIYSVMSLSGSKYSQIAIGGSTGLTSVIVDEITISGDGTLNNPLKQTGTFTPIIDSSSSYEITNALGDGILTIDTINEKIITKLDYAPTANEHLATKKYVDDNSGLDKKYSLVSVFNFSGELEITSYTETPTQYGFPFPLYIKYIQIFVQNEPIDGTIVVSLYNNNILIDFDNYAHQGELSIASGLKSSMMEFTGDSIDLLPIINGNLNISIDSIGTTYSGKDLTVRIIFQRALI